MSATAPLQALAAKPRSLSNSAHASLLLRQKRTFGSPTAPASGERTERNSDKLVQTNASETDLALVNTVNPRFENNFTDVSIQPKLSANIPAKLTVDPPGDVDEEEADRVANQVMQMTEPQLRPTRRTGWALPENQTDQLGHERARLQVKRNQAKGSAKVDAPPIVHDAVNSSGQPLNPATRDFMASRFGHDFSQIRVHTDETAAEAANALHANAFAVGSHIVFGTGQFDPHTSKGRQLLAHELTHTLQQRAAGMHATGQIQRDEKTEKEVKRVTSPNVGLREAALTDAEGQLAKRLAKRQKEIQDVLAQIGPNPSTKTASKAKVLANDLAKDLAKIIKEPDHPSVNKDLRKDIIESAKLVDTQKLKLKGAKAQWSKFDPLFADEKVSKALGTNSLSAAELKALVAQESGDLTQNDTTGDIAGIAQMGTTEEKRAGGAKGDRKKPEKAIPLAAKIMSLNAGDLDKALTVKPTGIERKKFIMGAYNGGVNLIVTAQAEAIKMKQSGKTWASLIDGAENSPLFAALKKTYAADPKNPNKWIDKYKEVKEYVEKIYARLP